MDEQAIVVTLAGTVVAALLLAQAVVRRRRHRRAEQALADNVVRGTHVPVSLHPVIDTEVCIGSLACLRACPEGDILGVVDGAARLVHAANCVGHGRCAASCPVNAIKLVFGTATRGVDLPEVDERFESSRPGVHIIGELAGMGLIRSAIEQGTMCAGYLAEGLEAGGRGDPAAADVVVIGAGPAGVGCALALRERGLSVRVLDRGRVGTAIANFPRQALITAGPIELPGSGKLRRHRVKKEELLGYLEQAISRAGLRIDEGITVTGLGGSDGAFTVETGSGPIRARKVVLATGRRGAPRQLKVPGEELAKVTYSLIDAEQYRGAKVLVIGGGDAAVEAACALAAVGGVEVALIHRGPDLSRATVANQARALELAGQGKLTLRLGCEVRRIEAERVVLQMAGKDFSVPNDYLIACLGGEAPLEFLAAMGVQVRRLFGEEGRALASAGARAGGPGHAHGEERLRWPFLAGGVILGLMALMSWVGWDYYPLPVVHRFGSPLHRMLKPASSLGLTIGIAATAVMLTNFAYALRKRWGALEGLGRLRGWLDVHVFVGVMSPLVIAFHAAFQSNNLLASVTYSALGIVVTTGLVGRYFYGLVPGPGGAPVVWADLLGQQERLRARLQPLVSSAADPAPLEHLLAELSASPSPVAVPVQLGRSLRTALAFRLRLWRSVRLLPPESRAAFREGMLRLHRLRAQASVFGRIKRVLRGWRSLHAALAVLLVLALSAHIGVAVYLGYGLR